MVAPFDYTSAFGQQQGGPFGGLMQGLQAGAQLAQMDERRALAAAQAEEARIKAMAQQAAIQRAQDYQTGLAKVLANPNRTWADFEPLLALAPNKEQIDAVRLMGERGDQRALQSQKNFTSNVLLALEADPTVAKRLLEDRIAAEVDPQQKQFFQSVSKVVDISPEKAAQMAELGGAALFGKDWYEGITKVREQRRIAEKEPLVVAELRAKVDEAQIKLRRLDAIQQAQLDKATSEAERERIQARFAERLARAELDLRGAQAAAQQATTRKTNEEINEIKRKASQGPTPVFNQQLGGFVVPPTAENPSGNFIPLNKAVDIKDQRSAVNALKAAGYDPETGEDRVSKLIGISTSGRIQAMTAAGLGAFDITTSGMKAINELAATANNIALEILDGKIGAGVSNADRDFIVGTLGDVANPNKTSEERLAGWLSAKNRMLVSGMLPPPTKPPRANPRSTGQVTPQPTAPTRPGLQNLSNEELLRQLGVTPARP